MTRDADDAGRQGNNTQAGQLSRRTVIAGLGAGAVAAMLPARPLAAQSNVIATENARQGTTSWRLGQRAPDDLSQVSGYCLQQGVYEGHKVHVCVGVGSPRTVRAEVYRMGWYGGTGGRLVTTAPAVSVAPFATPSMDGTTGEVICDFPVTFEFTATADWVSGVYLVKLIDSNGYQSYAQFVVRDSRGSDVLYQQPTTTYLAYSATPNGALGKSLYEYQSGGPQTISGSVQSVAVNFQRPYERSGAGLFMLFEADLVQFLERHSYDVSYATAVDLSVDTAELRRHKAILSAGHDEYWTQSLLDGWQQARDAGVSVCCFGANSAYWRVRLEQDSTGRNNSRMVSYKGAAADDPGSPSTIRFRDADLPEYNLWGVMYSRLGSGETNLVPAAADHWFWAGTGVSDGVELPTAIVGYEIDRRFGALPPHTEQAILADSPYEEDHAQTSIYRSTSGSWVWASGTVSWAWALGSGAQSSPAIQRATRNMLSRVIADGRAALGPGQTPDPPAPAGPVVTGATMAPFVTGEEFIGQQYLDFLSRAPDAGGMAYWVGKTRSDGSNMAAIVGKFLRSTEFAPRFEVARLYQAAFDRIPDNSGYNYWTDRRMRAGESMPRLAQRFISTPEFSSRYGAKNSDAEFVTNMYRNVFGRNPDRAGHAYWVGQLARGLTRPRLLLAFSEAPEFRTRFQPRVDVIAVYQGMLRRPPTTAEANTLAKKMKAGSLTTEQLVDQLLGATEYGDRFN